MLIRLLITVVLLAGGAAGYTLLQRRKLKHAERTSAFDPLLGNAVRGRPTILYFSTQNCVTCKVAQGPAIELLREEMGNDVNIIKVDAEEDADSAQRWKVSTVPTTFILDTAGKPVTVNQGAADAGKLKTQLSAAS